MLITLSCRKLFRSGQAAHLWLWVCLILAATGAVWPSGHPTGKEAHWTNLKNCAPTDCLEKHQDFLLSPSLIPRPFNEWPGYEGYLSILSPSLIPRPFNEWPGYEGYLSILSPSLIPRPLNEWPGYEGYLSILSPSLIPRPFNEWPGNV